MLVGREKELRWAGELLRRSATGEAGALLFSGEAGIGKTALLDAVTIDARSTGFDVRRVTGVPSESDLPYAALHALLAPDRRAGKLGELLETAIGLRSSTTPPLLHAVAAALVAHLSALAETSPLLVVIDDLQWLDPSSAEALVLCARHLFADRVAMIFARRSEVAMSPDESSGPEAERDRSGVDLRHLEEKGLGLLSVQEGIEVLAGLGVGPSAAGELAALAAGSPLALSELARSAQGGDRRQTTVSVPAAYSARISSLPPQARHFCAVAALSDDGHALAFIFALSVPELLFQTTSAGILYADEDGSLRFTHPLLRAAALAGMTAADRRGLHLALAGALDATEHRDRVAVHRSEATLGVDDEVAELMDDLARRAEALGALEEAARAMLRSSELSSNQDMRIRRMLQAAELRYYSGDTARSAALAARAAGLTTDPVLGCEAELMVAKATEWSADAAATVADLERLAARLVDRHPLLASRSLAQSAAMAFLAGNLPRGIDNGLRALDLSDRNGDVLGTFVARAHVGWNLFLAGRSSEAKEQLDIVEPAMRMLADDSESVEGLLVAQRLAMRLLMQEEWAEAEALVARSLRGSRRRGMRLSAALFGAIQGVLAWRRGRWDEAYSLVTLDLDVDRIPPVSYAWLSVVAAQVAASMGRQAEAERLVEIGLASAVQLNLPLVAAWANASRGHLELSRGAPAQALLSFDRVVTDSAVMGLQEPGFFLWHGDYLEALIGTGNLAEAEVALNDLRALASVTGRLWAHGIVARTTAVLSADQAQSAVAFGKALDTFAELGMPFETARTLLARGRATQAVSPDAAVRDLVQAEAGFVALGAELWAKQAAELRRGLGGLDESVPNEGHRFLQGLSPAETGVALCVASGSTNREVATELHVSARTVEFHLRAIYRKTGVKHRAELVARMLAR